MFGSDRQTRIGIDGEKFTINGEYTYAGRAYDGNEIEGLLFNSRMIQALFDDDNPDTVDYWAYPDTGEWDPERNVREFIGNLATYYHHGLRAVTINLQCGSPEGYSDEQPWIVSAYREDGSLKDDWMDRLERVLDAADHLGMGIILGLFYFGNDDVLADEAAVLTGVENAIDWLLDREYTNVIVEANNECDVSAYDHEILTPDRIHEVIEVVKGRERDGFRYPVGTSFGGGSVPTDNVVEASDFILMHGNGVEDPARIGEMVREVRERPSYEPMPVVFNEDDHFDFYDPPSNMLAAIESYASWGYFDPGENNYRDGYQSPPTNWGINTDRKQAFFRYTDEVTSGE